MAGQHYLDHHSIAGPKTPLRALKKRNQLSQSPQVNRIHGAGGHTESLERLEGSVLLDFADVRT